MFNFKKFWLSIFPIHQCQSTRIVPHQCLVIGFEAITPRERDGLTSTRSALCQNSNSCFWQNQGPSSRNWLQNEEVQAFSVLPHKLPSPLKGCFFSHKLGSLLCAIPKSTYFKNSLRDTWFLSKGKLLMHNTIVCFCLKDIDSLNTTYLFVKQKYIEHFTLGKNPHDFSFKALNICYGITHHSQTQAVVLFTNVNQSFDWSLFISQHKERKEKFCYIFTWYTLSENKK